MIRLQMLQWYHLHLRGSKWVQTTGGGGQIQPYLHPALFLGCAIWWLICSTGLATKYGKFTNRRTKVVPFLSLGTSRKIGLPSSFKKMRIGIVGLNGGKIEGFKVKQQVYLESQTQRPDSEVLRNLQKLKSSRVGPCLHAFFQVLAILSAFFVVWRTHSMGSQGCLAFEAIDGWRVLCGFNIETCLIMIVYTPS